MFEHIDLFDLFCLIFLFLVSLLFLTWAWNSSLSHDEESCVYFYQDNGYVLDSCKKYEEKLEALDIAKERP